MAAEIPIISNIIIIMMYCGGVDYDSPPRQSFPTECRFSMR